MKVKKIVESLREVREESLVAKIEKDWEEFQDRYDEFYLGVSGEDFPFTITIVNNDSDEVRYITVKAMNNNGEFVYSLDGKSYNMDEVQKLLLKNAGFLHEDADEVRDNIDREWTDFVIDNPEYTYQLEGKDLPMSLLIIDKTTGETEEIEVRSFDGSYIKYRYKGKDYTYRGLQDILLGGTK